MTDLHGLQRCLGALEVQVHPEVQVQPAVLLQPEIPQSTDKQVSEGHRLLQHLVRRHLSQGPRPEGCWAHCRLHQMLLHWYSPPEGQLPQDFVA